MLEDLPEALNGDVAVPRASLVLAAGALPGVPGNVWMGGAHSLAGEALDIATLNNAVIIDCAGDMPAALRAAAGLRLANVFQDVDSWPMHFDRLEANARHAARALQDHSASDVYAMCTHGMNRSGLAAGLVLRALGVEGDEAVRLIRLARPGALSNDTFRRIVEGVAGHPGAASRELSVERFRESLGIQARPSGLFYERQCAGGLRARLHDEIHSQTASRPQALLQFGQERSRNALAPVLPRDHEVVNLRGVAVEFQRRSSRRPHARLPRRGTGRGFVR